MGCPGLGEQKQKTQDACRVCGPGVQLGRGGYGAAATLLPQLGDEPLLTMIDGPQELADWLPLLQR